MRDELLSDTGFRWVRTSRSRGDSIFVRGGAEWPDFYLTLQRVVRDDFGNYSWVTVPIIDDHKG